jgi:CheY-specific phosphatase CheX
MVDHESLRQVFAESATEALRVMAEIEAVPSGPSTIEDSGVVATIDLVGGAKGRLVLAFPSSVAQEVARRILGQTTVAPAMVDDCIGEVANVVAGQAKARLFGTPAHFNLSIPRVTNHFEAPLNGDVAIDFVSDVGPFSLRVELSPSDSGSVQS